MTALEKLNQKAQWLTELEAGTVWTEYHWREALMIKQLCEELFPIVNAE
jgi:hypothetical protein